VFSVQSLGLGHAVQGRRHRVRLQIRLIVLVAKLMTHALGTTHQASKTVANLYTTLRACAVLKIRRRLQLLHQRLHLVFLILDRVRTRRARSAVILRNGPAMGTSVVQANVRRFAIAIGIASRVHRAMYGSAPSH